MLAIIYLFLSGTVCLSRTYFNSHFHAKRNYLSTVPTNPKVFGAVYEYAGKGDLINKKIGDNHCTHPSTIK